MNSERGMVDTLMNLSEQEKRIYAIKRQIVFLRKPRGDTLLEKGDPAKCIYVVLTGLVMVFRSGLNYADYSVGPGDCFGTEAFGEGEDTLSTKAYRAANDVHYCEVATDTFINSELFTLFRERLSRERERLRRSGLDRDSTTASDSSRNLGGALDQANDVGSVFFGPVGGFICTNGLATQPPPHRHADIYQARSPALERTPQSVEPSSGGAPFQWCYFPEFFPGISPYPPPPPPHQRG